MNKTTTLIKTFLFLIIWILSLHNINAQAWTKVGNMTGNIKALTEYNGSLIAGGLSIGLGTNGGIKSLAELVDTSWYTIGPDSIGCTYLCVYNGKLFITGGNIWSGAFISTWNGSSFIFIDTLIDGACIPGPFNIYNGNLYAAQNFTLPAKHWYGRSFPYSTFIVRWTGSNWIDLDTTLTMDNYYPYDENSYIQSFTINNGVLYMGISDYAVTSVFAAWDGNTFKILEQDSQNIVISSLATLNGTMYATLSNGNFAKWNGSNFDQLQIGISQLFGPYDGYIYASSDSGLARWDGNSWNYFGINAPSCMIQYNNELYGGFGNGVYILNDSSWIRFYNHVDNSDYAPLKTPKLLDSNYTATTQRPLIKICADGSNATEIKYTIKGSAAKKNIRFRVQSNNNNYDSVLNGTFNTGNYITSGDTVIARFTHPQYLKGNGISRDDTIEVFDISTGNVLYRHPIAIYRAPVLMVHGVWADRSSFYDMENTLSKLLYPPIPSLTWRVDYSLSNSYSFYVNKNIVPDNINFLLMMTRNYNYSAGKVTVIAHSMGGILTREYLQGTFYKYRNDIQSIITVNTPHAGAQSANFLLGFPNTLEWIMTFFGKNCYNGAVRDLAVQSHADSILNGNNLNHQIVPSHTISTIQNFAIYNWPGFLMSISAPFVKLSLPVFMNLLYNSERNDLIVPLSSQKASKSADQPFTNQMHSGSCANSNVIAEVETLLQNNPNDPTYFMQNGFDPPQITSYFKKDPWGNTTNQSTNSGQITIQLLTKPNYKGGDSIPIIVSSTGDINHLIICAGNSNIDLSFVDTLTGNYTYKYPVPMNAVGSIKIMAIGYDTAGFVDYDTAITYISPNVNIDSLNVYPPVLYVGAGQTSNIELTGYYNNGTTINLSYFDSIQYNITDTTIATHLNLNSFEGKKEDSTFITATYRNKSTKFPVYVIQNMDTAATTDGINNQFSPSKSLNCEIGNINIFPNPFNRITTIQFELEENTHTVINVYDIYGKQIAGLMNAKQTKGKHELTFDAQKYNCKAGIYLISIKLDNYETVKQIFRIE